MWQTQPLTEIPGWLMFIICKGVPAPFLKHPSFDPASGSSPAPYSGSQPPPALI